MEKIRLVPPNAYPVIGQLDVCKFGLNLRQRDEGLAEMMMSCMLPSSQLYGLASLSPATQLRVWSEPEQNEYKTTCLKVL